jgi:hypothetical protein
MSVLRIIGVVVVMLVAPVAAQNQDRDVITDAVKGVIVDPTTYAPAMLGWGTTRLDWQSSQPFFENGAVEHNARFTVSGHGDDTAVGYSAGNRKIFKDSLANLQLSLIHNVSEHLIERMLLPRYPDHRHLLRTIGWIERSAVASYWSYRQSAGHFRQWQVNDRRAQQLGYR